MGVSWSSLINLTKGIKKARVAFSFTGPGAGITMKYGTLCLPTLLFSAGRKKTPENFDYV
jgi:hypothetical protein